MKVADVLHAVRSSDCSTAPFRHMASADSGDSRDIDNGYVEGGVAISLVSRTYTGIRFAINKNDMPTTLPAGSPSLDFVVDLRLCAWDYDTQALRATTDNLASTINALPRLTAFPEEKVLVTADLLAPLFLHEGEWVLLGTAYYGDYPARSVHNISVNCYKPLMGLEPQLGFNNKSVVVPATQAGEFPTGGYTGGVPGPVGTDVSGNAPWMELLPAFGDPETGRWVGDVEVRW